LLPAVAQGAIAIECREGDADIARLLRGLDDGTTRVCVEAERAMNRALHGSCHVPVAGFAELFNEKLLLRGAVGDASDGRLVRAEAKGSAADPEGLGRRVAEALLAQGAGELLGH
jgi:hydroxymethylbilane synthase